MIPKSLKGRIFCFLTGLNVTLASYFFAIDFDQQAVLSVTSALLCMFVWITEAITKEE